MKLRGDDLPHLPAHPHLRAKTPPPPLPTTADGRNIDLAVATLSGEAHALKGKARTFERTTPTEGTSTTYYDQPILKAPVWKAYIPAYFFVGGLAGGCMVLGAAAQLARLRVLVRPARMLATGGAAASAALLIADLGRPARFLNMLRVFRPTSPMNVGTWILSGAGAAATASALLPYAGMKRLADASGLAAGVLGLGLASYTGVLIANTAVPAWHYGSVALPPVFVAGAAASAASALDLVPSTKRASRALRVFGTAGKIAELIAGSAWEQSLARRGPAVVRHVKRGRARALLRTSQALTAASLAASLLGWRKAAGMLGLGGALSLRFAIMEAGRSSALDPRATFEPQRAELGMAHASTATAGA